MMKNIFDFVKDINSSRYQDILALIGLSTRHISWKMFSALEDLFQCHAVTMIQSNMAIYVIFL